MIANTLDSSSPVVWATGGKAHVASGQGKADLPYYT